MLTREEEYAVIRKAYSRKTTYSGEKIKYKFDEVVFDSKYELAKWIIDDTTGLWALSFLKIGFELKADAVIYNLRFGGQC